MGKRRSRRTWSRREARVLARLGDELIHCIRVEKPLPIWFTPAVTTAHDMDMGIRTPCPGEPFTAYFHAANDYRTISMSLQISDEKVMDSTLELRPFTGNREV